jgi:predicted MFS family arabinose efflux permease
VADNFDRRWIGGLTSLLFVLCAATLWIATYEGWVSLPLIFTTAVFLGIARCFNGPAMSAITPRLVPAHLLPKAIAVSGIIWQGAGIAGPALGGILFAIIPWSAYAVATALFTIACVAMLLIAPLAPSPTDRTRHPLRQMIDGLTYVRENRFIMGTITLDLVVVLLAGSTALLPVYARDIFHVGSVGLGWLSAAFAGGAVLTGVVLGARSIENEVGAKMLIAVALFGLATVIFGLTAFMPANIGFPVALAALFACGSADMVSVFIRNSLVQIYTPDDMRGRVSSVSQLTISASNDLGEAESGFVASLIGPVATIILGGIGAMVATLLWAKLFPQIIAARRFDSSTVPKQQMEAAS